MSNPLVSTITLRNPMIIAGKQFKGDYSHASHYITDVQRELTDASVSFVANKVFGIYYDDPREKKPEELTSFQGVFVKDKQVKIPAPFHTITLTGKYLYVRVKGDPMKAIYEGYNALFSYIQKNNVQLRSPAGYQVSSFENGGITTEIYMELDH